MSRLKWTFEKLLEEASKYRTRNSFKHGHPSAYASAQNKGLIDAICSHMNSPYTFWTEDAICDEASKYQSIADFRNESFLAYNAAKKRKLLAKVCAHMKPTKSSWSEETISEEASKYSSRSDFWVASSGAHKAAIRLGILDKVCSHMPQQLSSWDFELLAKEAFKYETRNEFRYGNQSAYVTAARLGILQTICSHMRRDSRGYDFDKGGTFYVVDLCNRHDEFIGFGISGNFDKRLSTHSTNCEKEGFAIAVRHLTFFEDGMIPWCLEKHLKQSVSICDTGVVGFRSEAIEASDTAEFYRQIEVFFKLNALRNIVAESANSCNQNSPA